MSDPLLHPAPAFNAGEEKEEPTALPQQDAILLEAPPPCPGTSWWDDENLDKIIAAPGSKLSTRRTGPNSVKEDTKVADETELEGTGDGGTQSNRHGSAIMDADNVTGTTIGRFRLKRASGASVSSGTSLVFEAEDMESTDSVILKFFFKDREFVRERAILQFLNSFPGASQHVRSHAHARAIVDCSDVSTLTHIITRTKRVDSLVFTHFLTPVLARSHHVRL